MILQPYTYYRNDHEQRAFLLVSCPTDIVPDEKEVILIEWGKDRDCPVRLPVETFTGLIEKGLMQEFTPKYPTE